MLLRLENYLLATADWNVSSEEFPCTHRVVLMDINQSGKIYIAPLQRYLLRGAPSEAEYLRRVTFTVVNVTQRKDYSD